MKRTMKENENKGAAIIIVLCVLCIFMALSLSMIFMSFQVLNNAQKSSTKEQSKISAVTFNDTLKQEIISEKGILGYDTGKTPENVRQYIYQQISENKWPYYNTAEPGHGKYDDTMRDLTISIPETKTPNMGTVKAKMYWESSEDESDMSNVILVTSVTATFRKQSYTVKTQYELQKDSADNWKWTVTWDAD
ncbi:MAG: hypothetical protein PHT76_00825 [Anaerostipes sp.]|nr:hypothetical protein [Anaerostipes sp.]